MPQSPATTFIVHGTHITENLAHHKLTDVQRILEEKASKNQRAMARSTTSATGAIPRTASAPASISMPQAS